MSELKKRVEKVLSAKADSFILAESGGEYIQVDDLNEFVEIIKALTEREAKLVRALILIDKGEEYPGDIANTTLKDLGINTIKGE